MTRSEKINLVLSVLSKTEWMKYHQIRNAVGKSITIGEISLIINDKIRDKVELDTVFYGEKDWECYTRIKLK